VVLADDVPIGYRGSVLRLEIEEVVVTTTHFANKRYINIIDLREEDIIIGYN
jgi:hypothetical protein